MFSKLAVAAFVLPLFAQSAVAATCTRHYTVQAGDYCDKISAANNVSTYQLAAVNNGVFNTDCTNLQPGTDVCLGYEGQDCTTTYVVKPQDTCDKVTSAYGINSTLLYANNPQINSGCTNIYVGEVLCVAGGVAAPPADSAPINTAIPSTAVPASAAPITIDSSSVAAATTSTPAAVTTTSTASAEAASSTDDSDDEDLPYCDEL